MIELTQVEVRVLGCLIEKAKLTPDNYPLSMNSLLAACNQKSSRDPVMDLTEEEVDDALFELRQKKLAYQRDTAGSRVRKYEHAIDQVYELNNKDLAALCVLMLRGPQTPGEIKTRSGRLYYFESPIEVEETLDSLASDEGGKFVVKLPRQPGRREARYAHILCGDIDLDALAAAEPEQGPRVSRSRLEERVEALEQELSDLKDKFAEFVKQFE